MNARSLSLAAVALALAVSPACRKPKKTDPTRGMTAAQLLTQGEAYLKRGKMDDGRRVLRLLEENLPGTPEFPKAKLLLADSYFFDNGNRYAEASVEYASFLNYFPRSEQRDYALYHIALANYSGIASAERDQAQTRKALETFQQLLQEAPGSPYAPDAKAKIVQCWRRLAEHELLVGIFYVKSGWFPGAEKRLKGLMETYPEYVDRERAYYWVAEALRQKFVPPSDSQEFQRSYYQRVNKTPKDLLNKAETAQLQKEFNAFEKVELAKYREEAKNYYQKLVESYPNSEWTGRAKDRLLEMGTRGVKLELDS
ncbi:MAG: outer membrane protein assembly factor BamD [Holophagaceae bacterium]|nr:outer membrane protein assembly factor BamD [Holophagaceae bacterium]